MDGDSALAITIATSSKEVAPHDWDALANPAGAPFDPFVSWAFLNALEETGCVAPDTGWTPLHLLARDHTGCLVGAAPLYAKSHSYGEYVFDHAWGDAFRRAGGRYYPKLQCAVPFTPVPGRRLLAHSADIAAALGRAATNLCARVGASSVHVTFAQEDNLQGLSELGYLRRTGLQYHWYNRGYQTFADFLDVMSSNKRKNIRKERARAVEGLHVRRLQGADIKAVHWDFFFRCYLDTGARKWGSPYLNRDFFALIGERMAEHVVLFIAEDDGAPIASALNFLGTDCLYGRYWGALVERPFLHFELCYYQAIDLAIELNLARVEAGAQGEHKLARGYEPTPIFSAHWFEHLGLREAIARYLASETPAVAEEAEFLAGHTPFKRG